jgi:para-aminobenzoate synthetase component I
MTIHEFQQQLNEWGRNRVPFLFAIDFEMLKPQVWRLDQIDAKAIQFYFNGKGNGLLQTKPMQVHEWSVQPIPFTAFKQKFDKVMEHLNRGDSYVINLTVKSPVQSAINLQSLFTHAKAKYKLWLRKEFLCFSPETFIQIENGVIKTFPMKGTIDAAIAEAESKITSDEKEMAEHVTVVDLLRNDLGLVASQVNVQRFRYIDEIKTRNKSILQVSSEITGQLPSDYHAHLGDILIPLLPAGSISGAPKQKTIQIIQAVEQEPRGYYTGVAGYFDGVRLDSCVMIRFIEQVGNQFFYRSGAGITSQSIVEKEYQEIVDKIYVPIN